MAGELARARRPPRRLPGLLRPPSAHRRLLLRRGHLPADDPRQVDIRSDIYSLGCTLFFMLTGDVPFPGGTLVQKLRRQLAGSIPRITERRPDLPAALADLVGRMMAKSPGDRFSTPEDVAGAIDAYLHGTYHAPAPAPAQPGADHGVVLWRVEDGAELSVFKGHTGRVHAVAFLPDGWAAFSAGADGTVRRWPVP